MTSEELHQRLRSVPLPPRTPEYWEEFPGRIRTACMTSQRPADTRRSGPSFPQRLCWNWMALAGVAGLVLAALVWTFRPAPSDFSADEVAGYSQVWREVDALFPHQVRSVVFGPDGPELVLSEQATLPTEPTLVVRGCGPTGCLTVLTRSGQQVTLGGERLEVLQDVHGKVLVAGASSVWPSAPGVLRIQARVLEENL